MSNEASIIANPTSTPAAVSTGYQAQNVILTALMNGIDCSNIIDGVGQCTVKVSGPVDVNGTLYSITADTILTPGAGIGNYLIYLDGSGNTLTPTLTMTPGAFDETKNAHYTAGGKRILNWLVKYDGTDCRAYKLGRDLFEDVLVAAGTWTAPFSKVYEIWVTGKGGDSQNSAAGEVTGGAGGGLTGKKRLFVEAGTVWTGVFSALSGGNTTFDDGVTTLSAQNGNQGSPSYNIVSLGGLGGIANSGFDIIFPGGNGGAGQIKDGGEICTSNGGSSFYGQNNDYRGGDAENGSTYGVGATGAGGGGSGGTGASGLIRIIG